MKKRLFIGLLIVIWLGLAVFLWHTREASAPGAVATTKTPTAQKKTATVTPVPAFNRAAHSTSDPASIWVVVNKKHPLNPLSYAPGDLTSVGGGQYLRAQAAAALKTMLADAKAAGYSVTPASGYRSYATQVTVYGNEVKTYGAAVADSESARPGYSEHQTGWAIDLASGGCSITDCFANTPGGQWITANSYKYGFLLRYTAANTATTGYRAEAWHYRYIGTDLASELHTKSITALEEYFGITGGDY